MTYGTDPARQEHRPKSDREKKEIRPIEGVERLEHRRIDTVGVVGVVGERKVDRGADDCTARENDRTGERHSREDASWALVRRPDPTDRRAKLITLTESGRRCVAAGIDTIADIERRITDALGVRGHRQLRRFLLTLLEQS